MSVLNIRRLAIAVLLFTLIAGTLASSWLSRRRSQPESVTVAPDGLLLVGSASRPLIYKTKPDSFFPERFVDATEEGMGTYFFGVLADPASSTLWACQLSQVANAEPARLHSVVRGFDLATGAQKYRWALPGDNTMCNDLTISPSGDLYVSDTLNGRIYRSAGRTEPTELYIEDAALKGVDGISFLNGAFYADNLFTGKLYRIPADGAGKAERPVEIVTDQPLKAPDSMRAANGRLIVAESGAGRVSAITVTGDRGTVTVLKDGLKMPTGVEPAGDTIWITERNAGRILSIPAPR